MKFTAIFFFSLFGMAALAGTSHAGECRVDGNSLKSAIAAKTKSATTDLHICAVFDSNPSAKAGYVEASVQYAPAGERFCMTEDEVFTSRVTVKGECK